MRTLFLIPPSYDDFDGGAGARYQAKREVWSFWYPTWLSYPAGMLPGARLLDAPPEHMTVDGQSRHSKRMAQHDVRRLAADTWQRDERVQVGRDLAPMLVEEHVGHADDRLRLLPKEPGLEDQPFDFDRHSRRQCTGVGVLREQRRRDHVDSQIGGLRREDCGYEQLEGVAVVQLSVGVRMLRVELVEDRLSGPRRMQMGHDVSARVLAARASAASHAFVPGAPRRGPAVSGAE